MACKCCSENFSPFHMSCLSSSGSSCGSPCHSNLVYTTTSCSPSTCQLGSSLNSGCQDTSIEPTSCQRSCAVFSPCQMLCYYLRSTMLCSPCRRTYAGSLGFWPSSYYSLTNVSKSCILGDLKLLNYEVFDFCTMSYGTRFYYPVYLAARTCQSSL